MTVMDFDQILGKCGDFNRYQFLLLALFGLINILVSMHYFTQTIISFVPNHWCHHEKLENKTFSEIHDFYSKFENPSCTRIHDIIDNEIILSDKKCEKWIYDYDFGYESMNTEFNWVCESVWKARVGQSMFFVGSVIGTLVYGYLSDKYGRLSALILSNLSGFLGDFSTIFTTNVVTFSICRLISGLAADSNFYLMYILVVEYIRPSMRTMGINLSIGLFYCLGLVFTPWLAVAVGNWKYYLAATSIPILSVIIFYPLICESAQWLVTDDNIDGAILRLKHVAKFNGKTVTEEDFDEFKIFCEKQKSKQSNERKSNLCDMFKTPRLRKHTIILFFKSMVITLCFDVVSRNVEGLGLSPIVVFSLTSLAVLPSSIVVILFQDRIGRKATASGSLIIGGIFTILTGCVIAYKKDSHNVILLVSLQIIARFGAAISYESGAQYATELIPTCVRGRGVAAVHVAGFAISFLGSYILLLGTFVKVLPSIILGILFFTGSFVCLMLPETLHRTLPKTLEEGEEFGRGDRMFDFPCIQRQDKKSNDNQTEMSHL